MNERTQRAYAMNRRIEQQTPPNQRDWHADGQRMFRAVLDGHDGLSAGVVEWFNCQWGAYWRKKARRPRGRV
jgi:hypothetical protein